MSRTGLTQAKLIGGTSCVIALPPAAGGGEGTGGGGDGEYPFTIPTPFVNNTEGEPLDSDLFDMFGAGSLSGDDNDDDEEEDTRGAPAATSGDPPNFTLTLLRTPFLPPTYASFIVPLNLNKLDIKDYLYNAYGIHVRSVRSFIQQQRVRQDKPNAKRPAHRRWFRPRAIKKMTVEMDKPFVWPEEPDDFSAWDKESFDAVAEAQEKLSEARRTGDSTPSTERGSISAQAQRILGGDGRRQLTWEDVGEPVEVDGHTPLV
ncbi:MAG: hypothetical protein M1840_003220 [Geoglossum simile]|nr:MAG: hypothetical protein M1840_003220 [Geoglossum simile]